eukprot:CAMPEP_0119294286 /NCGR_PEP_ID=MMETSP1329-20130426/47661_1 /TAXON_ID=114041 /ORGANISM="Genus nov. species nov., Strain RCC1024" /LENGTH=95 /DNA_ID=CAMNT_0007295171 /DNA_START=106 /DNA_END=389 /DNA_ORIENTATION=-
MEPPAKVQRTGGDSALDKPDAAPSPGKEGAGLIARKRLEEEYRNWTVAAPQLYDVCMAHTLKWPSLTVEWLPGLADCGREGWHRHSLLCGTHTAG